LSEQSRLERLRHLFAGTEPSPGVTVSIGDDAAVLAPSGDPLVWTVDAAVEGVHFRRDWMSLEDVGFRSLMAAASDLAAMGAHPRGVLSALILPADFGDDDLDALARGQREAATALGTAVIGGNLARGAELSVTTTALGATATPILRRGARPGDTIAMAGTVGLARAGLEGLRRGMTDLALAPALAAYRRPRALIVEGLQAAPHARAAIDVSDGLALDVSRLAAESDVAIVLDADKVRAAGGTELREAALLLALPALDLALHGGDDYALVMAFAPGTLPTPFRAIGACSPGRGVTLRESDGTARPIDPRGFDHFAR
jgi:thiamine-monophosphate kinase